MSHSEFFGSTEGWSLEPVAAWLLTDGRRMQNALALASELTARLDAAGASVDRIRLTTTTLHPQLLAWGVFWDRSEGARPWQARHGVQNLDSYIGSPNQFVRDNKSPYRKRLGEPPSRDDHPTLEDLRKEGMTDYYALPIVFSSGDANVLTLATS